MVIKIIISILFCCAVFFGLQTANADDASTNLKKSTINILGGWTEVVIIYPTQEATKPGWKGKVIFPINIGIGAFKGAVREVGGAVDFLSFFKDKNVIDGLPGEEL